MSTPTDSGREHTAECYENGCQKGLHPAPRPGHLTGGPWTPTEALAAMQAVRGSDQ